MFHKNQILFDLLKFMLIYLDGEIYISTYVNWKHIISQININDSFGSAGIPVSIIRFILIYL